MPIDIKPLRRKIDKYVEKDSLLHQTMHAQLIWLKSELDQLEQEDERFKRLVHELAGKSIQNEPKGTSGHAQLEGSDGPGL